MDRFRAQAWRDVAGDARGFYESHPFVVLVGGAVLGSALASRPRPAERKRRMLGLVKWAGSWMDAVFHIARASHRASWGIPSSEGRTP